jgi:hypothetical protein
MAEVPSELAGKVVAADMRNHVKRVGEGENLSPRDRELFEFHAVGEDAEAMLKARTSKLLQKWLAGGRLSNAELEEIVHVLPAKKPEPEQAQGKRTVDHYEAWYGLQRRMYFRWMKAGREVVDGADLPPFDEPHLLEGWYGRMMHRGVFKHRFPKKLKTAIAKIQSDTPSGTSSAPQAPTTGTKASAAPCGAGDAPPGAASLVPVGLRGLMHEVDEQEKRVAKLRERRDAAYARGDMVGGDQLANQYNEELNQFSVVKQRAINTLEKEKVLVMKSEVELELGHRLIELVRGGMRLYDRIAPKWEAAADPIERRQIWREAWIKHCRGLAESKFAPELELEALA